MTARSWQDLLQKDRPWLLGFLFAGAFGMAAAIGERSFVNVFLLPNGQYEALYYVAWIGGLLLGAVAACYDEALGTREFLQQRPVPRVRLATARLLGCAIVLLGWLLLAPVLAWCGFALFDVEFRFGHWRGLPGLWGTGLVAVSAAAIGCFAGAMPAPWWVRLGTAAAVFVGTFLAIDGLTFGPERLTDAAGFVGGHLAVAAGLFWAAHVAMRHSADADRPWPQQLRVAVAGPATLGLALVGLMVFAEAEGDAVLRLHRVYPHPVLHDGRVLLVAEPPEPGRARRIVDAAHEPTGQEFVGAEVWLPRDLPRPRSIFRGFERPRWSGWSQAEWFGSWDARGVTGRILMGADGEAWWSPLGGQGMRRTGKGEGHERFAARSAMRRLDCGKSSGVVVHDAGTGALWRFDPERACFVPAPLPGGDRFVRFTTGGDRRLRLLDAALRARFEDTSQLDLVEGEQSLHALADGVWQPVAPVSTLPRENSPRAELLDVDPLAPVLEIRTADGITWRHEFAPRTGWERLHAGAAVLWSLWRAPIVQVVAHTLCPAEPAQSWLVDPLVSDGRRTWLVLTSVGLAALLAWRIRRRLQALGVPAAGTRFWLGAVLLLGPTAALACLVFERPRAYARRALAEPLPTPRILTPATEEEVA